MRFSLALNALKPSTDTNTRKMKRTNDFRLGTESKTMDFMGGRSANKSSVPYRVVASAKGYDSKVFKNKVGGYVIVYVDGHCFRNGYMGAQAGMGVWFGDGNPL